MTTDPVCPSCGANYCSAETICPQCRNYLETCLLETGSLLDDLDVTLTKQAQTRNHGMSDEIDPVKFMFNIGASNAADNLAHILMSWAAMVRDGTADTYTGRPNARDAAEYLAQHMAFIASNDAAADMFHEVTDACYSVERVMDIQPGRAIVGECSAGTQHGRPCGAILWARPGAAKVKCRDCDTVWDVKTRRMHTFRRATHTAASATTITRAFKDGDIALSAHRISIWASRGLITPVAPRRYIVGHVARLLMLSEAGQKLTNIDDMEPSK